MQTIEPPISVETVLSWGNEPAPLPEALVARPWIAVAENELGRIERDIQALEGRRASLLRHITAYRTVFAPHKRLPSEILRHIIILCVALQPQPRLPGHGTLRVDLTKILSDRSDARFTLRQVCSKWRSIILGTHELWTDVHIYFGWRDRRETRILLRLFQTWLSLGGKHPLTLDVCIRGDHGDIGPVLFGCPHRLRSLTVSPLNAQCVQDLLAGRHGSMAHLEELTLDNSGSSTSLPTKHSTIFLGSSHLRCTTLIGFSDEMLEPFRIPWAQLTQLNLENSRISRTRLVSTL
ncbi:hypothetical protein FB45DRAFT_1139908 [Roridomyces roridus]|uniref:F-box domain-containing protein n=1 Tax=Roridomyces roridus TaxID=1738132 RepID=A0AAD7B0I2_9AGAR|nr:hypothetical protein FB45DRAFT_1139908 [Roridomyces roridus]